MKIIRPQSKPSGRYERQSKSLLMQRNKQSFCCSLRLTTKARRKGHKNVSKLVVTGLMYKALESKKVSFLEAYSEQNLFPHLFEILFSRSSTALNRSTKMCILLPNLDAVILATSAPAGS